MAKKSKLLEKGTRMPDIRERGLDQTVREYLAAVQSLSSEAARAHRFTLLLQELFGLEPRFIEEYVAGPRGGRRGWNGNSPLLLGLLRNYNLRELSEDVLKSLYQELVDPKTRHDLGEYYTPDWLAARMVSRLLEEQPRGAGSARP